MAARYPRLALTIPAEYKKIYDDTAALMGIPTSKFITQLLIESSSSVKALQKPLKKAAEGRYTTLDDMVSFMDSIHSEVDKAQIDIEDMISGNVNKKPS